jgi:hypothetical protein
MTCSPTRAALAAAFALAAMTVGAAPSAATVRHHHPRTLHGKIAPREHVPRRLGNRTGPSPTPGHRHAALCETVKSHGKEVTHCRGGNH